jgi:hypothetical protein
VLAEPSPKFHDLLVILPVDVSVKLTDTGTMPEVTLEAKFATGGDAVTVIKLAEVLVALPLAPLAVKLTEYVPGVG